jgi:hypothetical protein
VNYPAEPMTYNELKSKIDFVKSESLNSICIYRPEVNRQIIEKLESEGFQVKNLSNSFILIKWNN